MPAVMPSKLMELSRAEDPKQAILKGLGPAINEIDVFGARVLVGTYIEPERTAGGIFKPEKTVQESLYQGSCGLVLKKGPWAFQDDPDLNIYWKGQSVDIGDWVVFRFSDAWEIHINGVSVRMVDDRDIRGRIADPRLLSSKPIRALA